MLVCRSTQSQVWKKRPEGWVATTLGSNSHPVTSFPITAKRITTRLVSRIHSYVGDFPHRVHTGRSGSILSPQCSQYTATSLLSPVGDTAPAAKILPRGKCRAYWSDVQGTANERPLP